MSDAVFPMLPGMYVQKYGPSYETKTDAAKTGPEYRVAERPNRGRWNVKMAFLRPWCSEHLTINTFFRSRMGRMDSFRFTDPNDYRVSAHGFGMGDGTSLKFQLQRMLGTLVADALGGLYATVSTPRTNMLLRTEEFANAAWAVAPGGGNPVATSNTAIAPDGTLTADTISGFIEASAIFQSITCSPQIGETYTGSLWLRGTAGQTIQLRLGTLGGTTDLAIVTVTLTGSWQRATVSVAIAHGSHTGLQFTIERSGTTATSVYAWGAQVEIGASATPYIHNVGTSAPVPPAYVTVNQTTNDLTASADGTFDALLEPNWSTVTMFKNGVALTPGTDFSYPASGNRGLVTFSVAPAPNDVLTWSGDFWWRVRFDDDEIDFEWDDGIWAGDVDLLALVVG